MSEIGFTETPTFTIQENEYIKRSQTMPIEDVQIKVGGNRGISGAQYFAMSIVSTAGSAGDATFRDLKLIGIQYDISKAYTQEIVTAMGNTTANISKRYTIDTPVNSKIKVFPGKVLRASVYCSSATQSIKLNTSGTFRYMGGGSTTLTNTNQSVVLMNTGNTDLSISLQFSTSAAERPNFSIFIEIF